MTRYIDTHCHLFWEDYEDDLDDVVARAASAGVDTLLIPATTLETAAEAAAIAAEFPRVFSSAGVHPHDAGHLAPDFIASLEHLAAAPKVVAIGEIGLDYHYDFCTPAVQQRALHAQLDLAKRLGLPVILHNRESDEDLLDILLEHQDGTLRGQFHCFSSTPAYAERVLAAGFHISFTGNVTFKKVMLDDAVRLVPADRLLLETDAPFMTPVPHRGTRNEPAHIPLIAAHIAALRGVDVDELAASTTANAMRLFHFGVPSENA